MASSALSSAMGSPLSAASCLCFLSRAGERAAAADGKSAPRDSTQAKDRISARNDLGAVETDATKEIEGEASDACNLMDRSCLMATSALPAILTITPTGQESCGTPDGVSNPYRGRTYRQETTYSPTSS